MSLASCTERFRLPPPLQPCCAHVTPRDVPLSLMVPCHVVQVHRKVPHILRHKVVSYFERKYNRAFFDEERILSDLSPSLRRAIALHNARDLIHNVPVFNNARLGFVNALIPLLINVRCPGWGGRCVSSSDGVGCWLLAVVVLRGPHLLRPPSLWLLLCLAPGACQCSRDRVRGGRTSHSHLLHQLGEYVSWPQR
jgi:hypothetical protein